MPNHRLWLVLALLVAASGDPLPVLAQEPSPPATDFYPLAAPCRAIDTRESVEGPLRPGVARWFTLDGCGVPLTAFAAVVNVTAADAVGSVEISAFPGDLNPNTSTVVAAGPGFPTRAALAILPLATDGTGTLGFLGRFSSSSGQADLVVDVTGYFDIEDPGSSEMPGSDDSQSTMGEPELPYDGDPTLLDDPSMYPPDVVGQGPSYGSAAVVSQTCQSYTGPIVTPIGIRSSSPRYLAYNGAIKLLVGASADVACHFRYSRNDTMLDKCSYGPSLIDPPAPGQPTPALGNNYVQLLDDLRTAGFNKTRLWVALGYETNRENIPFLWDAQAGYWRLDQKNQDYFDRIRTVVTKAKKLDMFVEVTFFAPFQGPKGGFSKSPWSWNANLARALDPGQTGAPTRAGFTSHYYAVINDTRTNTDAARNERMRIYQQKIIDWTIEELWCYDNVIWEIANEPEERKVYPVDVANWQKSMIAKVRAKDCPVDATDCTDHLPYLTRRHLIAVQPFTSAGGDAFINDAKVSILNGHYTQISTDPVPVLQHPTTLKSQLDLGALQIVQRYSTTSKVLGFNEGKITPLGGTSGTRSHVNGVVTQGRPEAARAEAWEFLLSRGGILDHWGYLSQDGVTSDTVSAIRQQLLSLKTFIGSLPLERLRTSSPAPSPSTDPVNWIVDNTLNTFPKKFEGWDTARSSQRYWAALQTDDTATTGRWFILYMHHSTRRCFDSKAQQEREFTAGGCDDDNNPSTIPAKPGPYMTFGGYDARVWTTPQSKRYRETFNVNLGPNSGTFDVFWINPTTLQTMKQQAVAWKQASCSLSGCIVCSNPTPSTPCSIGLSSSEGYDFDIVLKIVQRP